MMEGFFERHRDSSEEIGFSVFAGEYGLHFHSNVEIFYSVSGDCFLSVEGKEIRLEKGWFCFIEPFVSHENYGSGTHVALLIPQRYLEDYNKFKKGKKLKQTVFFDGDGEIFGLMERIKNSKKDNELVKRGLVNQIIGSIVQRTSFVEGEKSEAGVVREIVIFMEENYQKKITLASVAKALGYSKSRLSKIINDNFKCGFCDYLNGIRLKKFEERLEGVGSKKKIITLAFDCGFDSLQTFYRNFKKRNGVAPYEYYRGRFS